MVEERKKWFYWMAQLIGWGLFQLLLFSLSYFSGSIVLTTKLYIYFVFGLGLPIACSHGLRAVVLKLDWLRLPIWSLIWRSFLVAVVLSSAFEAVDHSFSDFLGKDYYLDEERSEYSMSTYINGVFLYSILFSLWLSFYYTYLFIDKSRKQEIKNLQFEASRNEIELKNLRAQINPHFLFNSLNSIKALVEIDKSEAKSAITKLSSLLRKSMQLSKNKLILIKEELEIVETYINLEKIRFEERIQSNISVDPETLDCKIPPLMIQTLIENAIKHGLSKSIDGGVLDLSIKKAGELINISIKNTGNLDLLEESQGIGLENTKKRLGILFGDTAQFKIFQNNDIVCVEIQIECKN